MILGSWETIIAGPLVISSDTYLFEPEFDLCTTAPFLALAGVSGHSDGLRASFPKYHSKRSAYYSSHNISGPG
jgi:hypothetical protein